MALTQLWVLFLYVERLLNVQIRFIVTFLQIPDLELPETKINCVKGTVFVVLVDFCPKATYRIES